MNRTSTEAYDFLVSLVGNAPYGILAFDLEGNIMMCNSLILKHLGIKKKAEEILETPLASLLEKKTKLKRLQKRVKEVQLNGREPFKLSHLKISKRFINIQGRAVLNGMILTTNDVTEAKQAAHKLTNALLEGQENERQRLAKEIHDGIGPLMSTLKMDIENIKNDLENQAAQWDKIEKTEELVQQISVDIRNISHALMPSALVDFGLVPALDNLCMRIESSTNLDIRLFTETITERLSSELELGLYRITQELLNNALKYAQAKNITIQIVKHPDRLTLTVEDDGVGFEKEKLAEAIDKGIGLRNIKTRSEALGGTFHLDSSPGNGVTATINISSK